MPEPSEASIAQVAARAVATGQVAIDTEFMSEGRYFPLLCLVQLAAAGEDGRPLVATIDAIADEDPAPLVAVLADPNVEVVVHAGRQDLAIIERAWATRPTSVFDTQIAAALTSTTHQSSYQYLVGQLLGKSLRKSESFTRWDQRPLTDRQLAYARLDVEHLLALAAVLEERLRASGRVEWAHEECRLLEAASAEGRDPEEVFRRLSASIDLKPLEAAVARELTVWREQAAREQDRPVRSVLPDRLITQLARRRPASLEALKQERGVGEGILRRHGKQILSALRRGEQADPIELPGRPDLPRWYGPLSALVEALIRARCEEQRIAPEMIANRAEVGEVVLQAVRDRTEPSANRLLTGWRREVVGEEVLELLRGERALRVGQDGHLVVDRHD